MSILPDLNYVRGLPDLAPSWRWVVKMPVLSGLQSNMVPRPGLNFQAGIRIGLGPGGLRFDASASASLGLLSSPVMPIGIVDSIDFTKQSIDADERFSAASKRRYPRFLSTPTVSISFFEDVSYATSQYLDHWTNLVVDDDHNYNIPAVYKKDIFLFAFDIVSNVDPVFVGTLRGCWPMSPGTYSFNNGGSDKVTFTAEFSVDETVAASAGQGQMGGQLGQNFQSIIGDFIRFSTGLTGGISFRGGIS